MEFQLAVNSNGLLKTYGYYIPKYGTKTTQHPDTGVRFSGYKIPMTKEAIELCYTAHKCFYNMHSIGWDVAITPNGPVLLEGNTCWCLCDVQGLLHGMKTDWMKYTTSAD